MPVRLRLRVIADPRRYQRVSPDCLPLSNGKKTNINGRILQNNNGTSTKAAIVSSSTTSCSTLEGKGFRFRSPSRTQDHPSHHIEASTATPTSPQSENNHDSPPPPKNQQTPSTSASPGNCGGTGACGGDMLLQWGQRKKARVSRAEIRALTDDSSSSSSAAIKAQRKSSSTSMPPPPPPLPSTSASNASRPRREASAFLSNRNLDERSGCGGNGSPSRNGTSSSSRVISRSMVAGKRSPPPEKLDRKMSSAKDDNKPNGSSLLATDRMNHVDSASAHQASQPEQEAAGAANTAAPLAGGAGEKLNAEVIEWPRIYVALSRKEKEDDFLAMKGTKLPQRPKKRAKNIDKALQYCFPGMWLSDLTRNRYEVREKKNVKKQKRRGLKGMESLDSESE
ncbi:hypothetical protein RGQ29_006601 [Quercus rubra]|uniref:Uncharacterized protein n=1 Tax=Quercus rubra TaxID=3512 RepID=A0AAN7E7L1_QUERU|nr:hypothetical protein RGQ29_006601 [Quercus rubra]